MPANRGDRQAETPSSERFGEPPLTLDEQEQPRRLSDAATRSYAPRYASILLGMMSRHIRQRAVLFFARRQEIDVWIWAVCMFLLLNPFTFYLIHENPTVSTLRNVATMRREADSQLLLYVLRIVVLGVALSISLLRWKRTLAVLPRFAPFMPFILWAMLSMFWSDSPKSTLNGIFALVSLLLSGFLMGIRLPPNHAARAILYSGFLIGIFSVIWAIFVPAYGVHQMTDASQSVHRGAWRGVLLHKNHLGQVCALYASAALFAGPQVIRSQIVRWALFFLMVFLIIKSTSASALVILPLSAVLVWYVMMLKPMQQLLATIYGMGGIVFGWMTLTVLLTMLGRDMTFSGRTTIWAEAFVAIWQRPFTGYGYMSPTYGNFAYMLVHIMGVHGPHSSYIDTLLALGFIGLVLFFVPVVSFCIAARGTARIGGAYRQGTLVMASLVMGWLIASFTEANSRPFGAVAALGMGALAIGLAGPRPQLGKRRGSIVPQIWGASPEQSKHEAG